MPSRALELAELVRVLTYDNASNTIVGTTSISTTARSKATKTAASAANTTILAFNKTTYEAADLTITASYGGDYHTTKLLVTHDGTATYDTQYGDIYSGSSLTTYASTIDGANVNIVARPTNASTVYNFLVEYVEA